MERQLFEKNLDLLTRNHPELARRIQNSHPGDTLKIVPSRAGSPTLLLQAMDGSERYYHSSFDPVREAVKFIESHDIGRFENFIVYGFGLGYHLVELVKRAGPGSRILVFEKDPSILHGALKNLDLAPVFLHPGFRLILEPSKSEIESILEDDRTDFSLESFLTLTLKSVVETDRSYYVDLEQKIHQVFRQTKIDFRTRSARSRIFHRNIADNWDHILQSAGVSCMGNAFKGVPGIIVAAGPSLDKNIGLLKHARDRAVLITVGTALRPVLNSGVIPDFAVAIDPDEITPKLFNRVQYPEDLWLVFDPCVPEAVVAKFDQRTLAVDSNVYLSQWISRYNGPKGTPGLQFSVAHTAFFFARFLGCDPVILVGQDLAFNHYRLHCTDTHYNQEHQDRMDRGLTLQDLDHQKYRRFAETLTPTMDIFGLPSFTTASMDTYNAVFSDAVRKKTRIFNATEGGSPIPGVPTLTLREAIHLYCDSPVKNKNREIRQRVTPPNVGDALFPALTGQLNKFEELRSRLEQAGRWLDPGDEDNETAQFRFVDELDAIYRSLMEDRETVQLLQDFAFSDFLHWYQATRKIARITGTAPEKELYRIKFERDRRFFGELLSAVVTLENTFQDFRDRVVSHKV